MIITQDIIDKIENFTKNIVTKINSKIAIHNIDRSAHSDKQLKSNIVTSWGNVTSDDKYPSEKLVKDTIDNIEISGGSSADITELEERVSVLEEEWGEFYDDMAG